MKTGRSPNWNLSEEAYQRIRSKILKADFPLGAELSRRRLAAEFGMSFLPVSQALQRLESEGLVESKPRVGTRVKIPTALDVRGHYIVREALESQSARLFAEKVSPQESQEIQTLAAELDSMYADPTRDLFETFTYHDRLHRRIAECTGCQALCDAIEKSNILVLNWLYNSAAHFSKLPAGWHGELVNVLCQRDPERADKKMREHVRYGLDEVLRRLETYLRSDESRSGSSFAPARK